MAFTTLKWVMYIYWVCMPMLVKVIIPIIIQTNYHLPKFATPNHITFITKF
jgi:hypothetical protein